MLLLFDLKILVQCIYTSPPYIAILNVYTICTIVVSVDWGEIIHETIKNIGACNAKQILFAYI